MSAKPVDGAVYDAFTGGLRCARTELDNASAVLQRVPGMGSSQSMRAVAIAITQVQTARMWVREALDQAATEFIRGEP